MNTPHHHFTSIFKQLGALSRTRAITLVGVSLIVLAACLLYWFYSLRYVNTDDAYINANVVQISPRVTGQIAHLYVTDNQFVKKGQALFDLDPMPFQIAIEKADAELAINQAALRNAQLSAERTLVLVKQKAMAPQTGDSAVATLQSAAASVRLAKANLDNAKLQMQYTHLVAPTNGWVSNASSRVGDVVNANQPLFALVSNAEYWVDANFKETELTHIHPGQSAKIKVDMYPGKHFDGVVESISSSSGTAFSLLPPQNATGNWVKVTQRVPVRVRVIHPDPKYPLRIGTTASITIDIHSSTKDSR